MIRAILLPIAFAFAAGAAAGQTPVELQGAVAPAPVAVLRTPEGRPDFGGYWSTAFITSTGRMQGAKSVVASDEEAKQLSRSFIDFANSPAADVIVDPDFFVAGVDQLLRVKGEWRTSLITSPATGVQNYTTEGQRLDAERRAMNDQLADGPEMRPLFERCIVGIGSAPLTTVPGTLIRQIVQTPDHIVASDGNDTRIVGVNSAPRPSAITAMLGDSTAYWEGDVLVVHTTGLSGQVHKQIITRPQSRVIERFELIGPDELFYQFTVEDTAIYAEPFSAEFVMKRSRDQVFEYSCHEHNYSMVNILQAGRVADAKAKTKAKAGKAKGS